MLTTCSSLIQSCAERIVAAAAELTDEAVFVAPLRQLVTQLPECLPTGMALDTSALRAVGADDALITRLLRAIEAECIEVLRNAPLDPPDGGYVLALRRCIRNTMPRATINPGDYHFYEGLLEGATGPLTSEQRRLVTLFNGVMTGLPDMVYVHDTQGNLLYVNKRGFALTRFSREDLLAGLSIHDFVAPEYLDLVEARLHTGATAARTSYTIEIYAKDGERIPIEISTRPIVEDGKITAIIGVAHDLRLERRLQTEIRRSNTCLENLLAHAPMGVLIADCQCLIREANSAAATLLGAAGPTGLVGLAVPEVCDDPQGHLRTALAQAIEKGSLARRQCSGVSSFGTRLDCDVTVVPLHQKGHPVEGLLVLMTDATRPAPCRSGQLHAERLSALGEVIAGIAHEINNPLTGILGYAQLLLTASLEPPVKERLENIVEEAQRCRRIVQDLQTFSEHAESERSLQDLNGIVADTLSLCEYQLKVDDIAVSLHLLQDLPWIKVNRRDLQRVFLNLIDNAHHALMTVTDRKRELALHAFVENDQIHVRFVDNGPGIPKSAQSKVFDPFFTTKNVGDGTGLGLSVCYGIIRSYGGQIRMESQEGGGAAFTIMLPIESDPG